MRRAGCGHRARGCRPAGRSRWTARGSLRGTGQVGGPAGSRWPSHPPEPRPDSNSPLLSRDPEADPLLCFLSFSFSPAHPPHSMELCFVFIRKTSHAHTEKTVCYLPGRAGGRTAPGAQWGVYAGGWILLLTRQTSAGTCPVLAGPSEAPGSQNRALEAPGPSVVCRQEGAAATGG